MNKFRQVVDNQIKEVVDEVAINTQGVVTGVIPEQNSVWVAIRNTIDSRAVRSILLPWPAQTNGVKTASPEPGTLVSITFCDGNQSKPIISGIYSSEIPREVFKDENRKPVTQTRMI